MIYQHHVWSIAPAVGPDCLWDQGAGGTGCIELRHGLHTGYVVSWWVRADRGPQARVSCRNCPPFLWDQGKRVELRSGDVDEGGCADRPEG